MRDISPDLMDILGPASALPIGTDGAADDGAAEYVYRFAPLVGIYGGTLEVFRNMIAQYVLGLGKPNYSPPKPVSALLISARAVRKRLQQKPLNRAVLGAFASVRGLFARRLLNLAVFGAGVWALVGAM